MNFENFYKQWIRKNVPTSEIYGNRIEVFVAELCKNMLKQNHSGVSFTVTTSLFQQLISDYINESNS